LRRRAASELCITVVATATAVAKQATLDALRLAVAQQSGTSVRRKDWLRCTFEGREQSADFIVSAAAAIDRCTATITHDATFSGGAGRLGGERYAQFQR